MKLMGKRFPGIVGCRALIKKKTSSCTQERKEQKRAESLSKNGKNWDLGAGRLIGRFFLFFFVVRADVARNIRRRWTTLDYRPSALFVFISSLSTIEMATEKKRKRANKKQQ